MIPSPPQPKFAPGTRVRVQQRVRVGSLSWVTQLVGIVQREGARPVGGMEMGAKALYCHQPTILLKSDTGELTVVAMDENTLFEVLS